MSNSNSKVQQFGRIQYIEPNDFIEEKYKGSNDTFESYDITHPYEDYSLSVDLQVIIPNRNGYANNSDNSHTIQIANKKINGDTISFFSGTDGYMTNTPGTTTYVDLIKGNMDGVNESLGITNIYISYTSYFYPEVTISFSDIRGSALMMPNEEIYMRATANEIAGENKYNIALENFFSAVFSFPSPEFKLNVKGFYGKKVEYSLMIEDFKSSFNNQTGNFDANIKFIGKMYGVYTDIPMSYLLIAPYCRYGSSSNNETIWQQKNFTIDGYPMPTLIEFKEQITKLTNSLGSNLSYRVVKNFVSAEDEKRLLLEIQDYYTQLVSYIKSQNNQAIGVCDDNLIFLKCSDTGKSVINTRKERYETQFNFDYINNYSDVPELLNKLYDKIEEYNNTYTSKSLPYLYRKVKTLPPMADVTTLEIHEDYVHNRSWDSEYYFLSYGEDYPYFSEKMISLYRKTADVEATEVRGLLIDGNPLCDALSNRLEDYDSTISYFQGQTNDEIEYQIESILGFNPSIKNIFMILMAHLETFMELYVKLITNITGENSRTVSKYGLTFNETDINNYGAMSENSTFLPPFPLVKNKRNNEIAYPSQNIMNNNRIEETKFIDSFLNGTFSFLDELQKTDKSIKELTEKSVPFLPTCFTDFYILKNPYENTFKDYDGTLYLDRIMTYFGYRYITKFVLRGNENEESINFGACEAYNFWRQNISLDRDIINKINTPEFSYVEALRFLYHNSSSFYLSGGQSPCYENNEKTGHLIKYYVHDLTDRIPDNKTITVPDIRSHPVCIEDTLSNFWNSVENENDSTTVFRQSLKGANDAPTKYIHLIEKDVIIDWVERIKKTNFEQVPNLSVDAFTKYSEPGGQVFFSGENIWYGKSYTLEDDLREIKQIWKEGKTIFNNDIYPLNGIQSLYKYDLEDAYEDVTDDDGNVTGQKQVFMASLDGFQSEANIPIFFHLSSISDMRRKAEAFLMSIPHNFINVGLACRGNGGVITMPYVTQLFLGMIMEHIINDSDEELNDFIDNSLSIYGQHLDENFIQTLCCLMRSHDDKYLEYTCKYIATRWISLDGESGVFETHDIYENRVKTTDSDGEPSQIEWFRHIMSFYRSYFQKDILNLVEKYQYWRDDENAPGFTYLYRMYALKENNAHFRKDVMTTYGDDDKSGVDALVFYRGSIPSVPPIEIEWPNQMYKGLAFITTGNTLLQRFMGLADNEGAGFMPNGSNKGEAYTHTNDFGGNPRDDLKAHMLNAFYLSEYGPISNNAFTDRYRKIAFQFKEGEGSEWYEYLYGGNIVNDYEEFERKKHNSNYIVYLTFNRNFEAYKHLDMLFKRYDKLVIPYNMVREATKVFDKEKIRHVLFFKDKKPFANTGDFEKAFNAFKEGLKSLYKVDNIDDTENTEIEFHKLSSDIVSINNKLSMYRTFKNLYDKHLTDITSKIRQYQIKEANSEFKRCYFIDTYYNNLGDKLKVNSEILCKLLDRVTEGYTDKNNNYTFTSTMNVLEFMSSLCQEHGMMLLCTPFFNGSLSGNEGIENLEAMFSPISYNDSLNMNNIKGPSYICFYPHQASQHLDNRQSQYKNDGFNILDINDNHINSLFSTENTNTDGEYNIPAFAVEYGSQKQSIFKNVNVNMDNPQVTEASVAYQFDLIKEAGGNPKEIQFEGQDLFKIYTNYSYTCQVDMMGCAQIQPLMYFQLNNIPMFKGVYQIIQVTHNIVPGDMTTSFKGVRINRNKIPMIKGGIIFTSIDNIISNMDNVDVAVAKKNSDKNDTTPPDLNNIFYDADNTYGIPTGKPIGYQKFKDDFGENIFFRSTSSGIEGNAEKSFNQTNPELRKLFYAIMSEVENKRPNLKVYITSSTRDISRTMQSYATSDHAVGYYDNKPTKPSKRRTELKGKPYGSTEEVSYAELGCALDLITFDLDGNKNGTVTNIELFGIIAINFSDYIRQLIWEHSPNYGDKNDDNEIGNCIHLSSYGKRGPSGSDKTEIFVSNDSKGKSIKADNIGDMSKPPKNIPITFLEIIYRIPENKFKNVTFNNWTTKPTREQIKAWIDALHKI